MKKNRMIFCAVVVCALTLTGCTTAEPTPTPTLTLSPTITRTPTMTPTLTFTPTYTPTSTSTLTPRLTLTPTPTPTFAWTPLPTLSTTEEKIKYIHNLIRTNGNCDFPCFLGIEVGVSNWQNVEHIFRPVTNEMPDVVSSGYAFGFPHYLPYANYSSYVFFVYMTGSLSTDSPPRVEEIEALFKLDARYIPSDFRIASIGALSLPDILEDMGVPSGVSIGGPAQYEKDDYALASMRLVYEEAGFVIDYYLSSPNINPDYDYSKGFCFIPDWIEEINLHVVLPENEELWLSELSERSNFLSRTDLTLEDFYNIGTSGDPAPCFEVND